MIFLVLDILLVLLIVLFMPIGFWRGPIKELFVTLGIMFGVLLADFWSRPWGADLADVTDLRADGGAFIIAMMFLVASTFILGYGLGATLAPTALTSPARAIGAAIAAFNGMLVLSFSLQYVRLFLLSDSNEESLTDSYVARFLLDEIGWVLLAVAVVAVPLLLFVLITGRQVYADDMAGYGYEDDYVEPVQPRVEPRRVSPAAAVVAQTLPPRVPVARPQRDERVTYKAEPVPARRNPNDATRQLNVPEQRATAEPPRGDAPAQRMDDTDPHIVIPSAAPTTHPVEAQSQHPAEDDSLAPGYTRCRVCHAVLGPDTMICPNCGTLR